MIEFVPYEPFHFKLIEVPPAIVEWHEDAKRQGYAEAVKCPGSLAWTGIENERLVGCAGLVKKWEGNYSCWAVFAHQKTKAWPAIVRKVHREMEALKARRIEMTVVQGFDQGCRLAFMLGFEVEGLLNNYGPDGKNHFMFAKVRR